VRYLVQRRDGCDEQLPNRYFPCAVHDPFVGRTEGRQPSLVRARCSPKIDSRQERWGESIDNLGFF